MFRNKCTLHPLNIAADCVPLRKNILISSFNFTYKNNLEKIQKTFFFFFFNMKISQKLVSLRCRVLVKNKRLVVFWLLIKDACIDSWGEKQKNALISSACQYLQTQ